MTSQSPVQVYSGKDLNVYRTPGLGKTCWVTFTGWGTNLIGFGHDFFPKEEIPAIYFTNQWSHWWQSPELAPALERAKAAISELGYDRVIVYGASMGAYGAGLCSGDLNAEIAILIAPQFTIDPNKPPRDHRWAREAAKIQFTHDDMALSISKSARKYLIYDPLHQDRYHAALFARTPNTTLIPVPFGEHVPGQVLQQAKLLKNLLFAIAAGCYDQAEFRAALRQRRRSSKTYWVSMSLLSEKRRPALALDAMARALDAAPGDGRLMAQASAFYLRVNRLEEALKLAEGAVRLRPNDEVAASHLPGVYMALKRYEDAERAVLAAISLKPNSPDLFRRLSHIYLLMKQWGLAVSFAERAVTMDPMSVASHFHLAGVLEQQGSFEDSLAAAKRGLGIDAKHIGCLRIAVKMARKLSLLKEALLWSIQGSEVMPNDVFFQTYNEEIKLEIATLQRSAIARTSPSYDLLFKSDGVSELSSVTENSTGATIFNIHGDVRLTRR